MVRPRALAPLFACLLGAIAVVAVSTPGEPKQRQPSAPLAIAEAVPSICTPGTKGADPAAQARQRAFDAVLSTALRTVRSQTGAPAVTAAVVVCGRVLWADATGVLDLG